MKIKIAVQHAHLCVMDNDNAPLVEVSCENYDAYIDIDAALRSGKDLYELMDEMRQQAYDKYVAARDAQSASSEATPTE